MSVPELFAEIAGWAITQGGTEISKLPGTWNGESSDWKVRINGHREDRDDVPPYSAVLEHKRRFAFAVVGVGGGSISGASEDEMIAHFRAEREASE